LCRPSRARELLRDVDTLKLRVYTARGMSFAPRARWRRSNRLALLSGLSLALALVGPYAQEQGRPSGTRTVPRFAIAPNPLQLSGPVRRGQYAEASGRRAAFLGREEGTFEAWAYPLKILHEFALSVQTAAYAEPIPVASLATWIDVRPEIVRIRYAHAAFTVDALWIVPLDATGGLVLLDIDTSTPLTVIVRFRPDLKPMWPAALGGQYSYWDADLRAYVIGEASRKHAAIIGAPLAAAPPEQPAHNLPDAPLQFAIPVEVDTARAGLVSIALTATAGGLSAARESYAGLLENPAAAYHASEQHYRRLRDDLLSLDTPDDRIDLALEWGKVALDKGFVCNADLGCGLIAGLGPSGTTERPGFGWYFGGDAFMSGWALTAYGDLDGARQALEFLRAHQRADGKMPHEISQGAGYLRWFEDYPYAYYHADTTPLYVSAVADWARASGDAAAARAFWPSVRRAYEYCLSADEDGDGVMDNSRAGLAAVETGALRSRDVRTDVYLAATWVDATRAASELAALAGEEDFAAQALEAHRRARAAVNRRFAQPRSGLPFAIMKDGSLQGESTVWPAVGLWRGVFDRDAPAVGPTLDRLASYGIATDWGARMLTRESALYDPLSYNNGAVWPFVTGFAALALYEHGRTDAGWAYVEALGELAFIEPRGYTPELFSGDRLRSTDAAVPHQLFASAGFVSGLLRGMLGFDAALDGDRETLAPLVLRPALPAGWPGVRVRNLRWGGHVVQLALSRTDAEVRLEIEATPGPLPVRIELPLPPGTLPARLQFSGIVRGTSTWRQAIDRQGVSVAPVHEPLASGQRSTRLRVIETRLHDGAVVARVVGLRGRSYAADVFGVSHPSAITGVSAATANSARGATRVTIAIPDGAGDWGETEVRVPLGR
jgi:glycogen debranching enzyme